MKALYEIARLVREDATEGALLAIPVVDPPPRATDTEAAARLVGGLTDRTAMRFLADKSLSLVDVSSLSGVMSSVDRLLWPDLSVSQPLQYLLVARDVEELRCGIYAIRGGDPELIVSIEDPALLSEMVLQPEFASAPALVLVVGSLESSLRADSSHGHRILLERAGAACEAAWLEAVRVGLGGSIFAGFLPSSLRELLSVDGYHSTQLLALALGHPHPLWTAAELTEMEADE